MKSRQLGQSSVYISPIILGAWAIGGWMWGGNSEDESVEAIQASLEHGVNTIDTAAIYGMGYSEEVVRKAIQGKRNQFIIATKGGLRWDSLEGADPWEQQDRNGNTVTIRKNSRPDSLIYECEQSLKRLGTDVIDLYQIHWPDASSSIEEAWQAMAHLKKAGKVRAIGLSNYSLEQLKQAQTVHPIDSIQPPYSLIRRGIEQDMIPFCQQNKIAIIVYSPLERGLLTGKVSIDRQFKEGDHRAQYSLFSKENRQQMLTILEKIRPIASRHHATLSQVILNCTMHMPGITGAIVGARNAKQAIENAEAAYLELSEEERKEVVETLALPSLQQPVYSS